MPPLSNVSPPSCFNLSLEEHDTFRSSNESTLKTTDETIRCAVCSSTIAVQNCRIIQAWDSHTWNTLKTKKYIPSDAQSVDQEVRNTISMCSTHTTLFERYYFFIRYIPRLQHYVFINYSGVDDPMLTRFDRKSITLDVKDPHIPFATLFLIHEQRVLGFWPLVQQSDIPMFLIQEFEIEARCDTVARLLQQMISDNFDEVCGKIIEIINEDVLSPKTPSALQSSKTPSSTSTPPQQQPEATLTRPHDVDVKLEPAPFDSENDIKRNEQPLGEEEEKQLQKTEEKEKETHETKSWRLKKFEKELPPKALGRIIDLIYSHAVVNDAKKMILIASLLRKVMERTSAKIQDDSFKGSDGKRKPIGGGQLVRKHLLNRCHEDFKSGLSVNESISTEENEAARQRYLGLLRLMAELYKLQMLTERIMHESIKFLLVLRPVTEECYLEGACMIFMVVGGGLDTPKARAHIDVYFKRMKEYIDAPNISSRTRSMLQDVIALRNMGWIPTQPS